MKATHVLSILLLTGSATLGAEVWPYHESFETGLGRWTPLVNSEGYQRWYRNFGSTSSYNTGPSGAHDGDWYCYIEASSYFDQTYEMEATFDLSSLPNPAITFRYHMYGGATGALQVEVNTGSGWKNVLSIVGQQNTGHNTAWNQAEIILGSEHVSTNTLIRFKGTTGSTWTSDISIDDIWIHEKQTMPSRFEWTPIEDRQFDGTSFPVQLTAVNYMGQPLTGFNGAVELTAWSAGFGNACQNGDFEAGVNSVWTPYASAISPGEYLEAASVNGSGIALYFRPDTEYDGMSQVVNVSGGERYTISAKFAVQNNSASDNNDTFNAQILIDGVVLDSQSIYGAYFDSTYSYILSGYFDVPESEQEGTRTVSIVAKSTSAENPDLIVSFDDVSVNFAPEQALDVTPGVSGDFVNGVWNGSVTMDYRLPAIHLLARYVDVTGESDTFTTYVSAYDLDFDGMVDDWEEDYFPSTEACDPEADDDEDGYSNRDEFIIGTNPILNDSHLALRTRLIGGQCVLDWYATDECTYDVQWTPNLQYTPFTNIAENVSSTQASFTNNLSNVGFYRIKVHKK